jgi:hypothetical protein
MDRINILGIDHIFIKKTWHKSDIQMPFVASDKATFALFIFFGFFSCTGPP